MGIVTQLNNGKKIKFDEFDSDSWGYDGVELQQYIDGVQTGNLLVINSISEESITIDWGDVESTLAESDITFVD